MLIVIGLLFFCDRLLFAFLDISSVYMGSGADMNSAGKLFLLVCPLIFIGGVWLAYRVLLIASGVVKYKGYMPILLALYGGLFGVASADMVAHVVPIKMESNFLVNGVFSISFFILASATFYGAKKRLAKISGRVEWRS